MDKDKWIGVFFLLFGALFLRHTIKSWVKGSDIFARNGYGLLVSIGSIIGGIMFLLGKMHW